jgi:hypothetical protein
MLPTCGDRGRVGNRDRVAGGVRLGRFALDWDGQGNAEFGDGATAIW